ncbi:hypothetical protein [Nocardia sp. NPDC057227]|uniref:hypothetical protein n=1 Tax=Nocardia sp. NPDC057227 TaxID=3346056 RepID=UPI00362B38D5
MLIPVGVLAAVLIALSIGVVLFSRLPPPAPTYRASPPATSKAASSAGASTKAVTPTAPADPIYADYVAALEREGIVFDKGTGYGSDYKIDTGICESIRGGRVDAFDLAGREGVALATAPAETSKNRLNLQTNGRRITAVIPIICPDQQSVLDEALSGNPRMINLRSGKHFVSQTYDPTSPVVQPGTYSTTKAVSDCYWERLDPQGEILDNNFVSFAREVTVTIAATDGAFNSRNCGDWKRVTG